MTEDDIDRLVGKIARGFAVICNVDFGYMVGLTVLPNGRARVDCHVDPPPIEKDEQAEYARKALSNWQKRLTEWDMKGAGHVRH